MASVHGGLGALVARLPRFPRRRGASSKAATTVPIELPPAWVARVNGQNKPGRHRKMPATFTVVTRSHPREWPRPPDQPEHEQD